MAPQYRRYLTSQEMVITAVADIADALQRIAAVMEDLADAELGPVAEPAPTAWANFGGADEQKPQPCQ